MLSLKIVQNIADMKQIFSLLLAIVTFAAHAQTKEIAFKSHSGNMEYFNIALKNDLFGNEASNFGNPYVKPVEVAYFKTSYHLDSVIYISKSKAVVVKKMYRRKFDEPLDSARFMSLKRDTLYDNPLFSMKHSLDSIKSVLIATGEYDNAFYKAVFIGYDNKKYKAKEKKISINNKTKENTMLPVAVTDDNNNPNSPFDISIAKALAGLLLLSLLGGWISWRFNLPQLQKA
jgi:hypothetical protein